MPFLKFDLEFKIDYIKRMDKIKIIFSDFDWTLFDHKTRTFNPKGIEGLNIAHKNGVKLVINTARTYYALKHLKTFDYIPFDGFVLVNGGITMLNDTTLYADYINTDIKDNIIKTLNDNNLGFILITQFKTYIKEVDKKLINDFYNVFYEPYPIDFNQYKNEEVLSIQVFATPAYDSFLKNIANKYNLIFNRVNKNNVELFPIDFLKSKGVKAILNHLNITPDEAMAFGDDVNDIPMFNLVMHSVCLGNGNEEAKKHVSFVTDSIENDGMFNALKKFKVI